MTHQPVTVFEDIKLEEALQLMEERTHPLNVLPVLKKDGCLYGLFRLHDAYDH
jgi:CBS domain-containing protein